jgi:predicted PurR-regulated permease PerM
VRRYKRRHVSRELLFPAFFFAVFLFLLWQVLLFLAPFFTPLVWAVILALTFYPATTGLTSILGGRRSLASVVLVVVVLAAVVLPSVFLGTLLVRQAGQAYERVQEMVSSGQLARTIDDLGQSRIGQIVDGLTAPFHDKVDLDPAKLVLGATGWISSQVVSGGGAFVRNALASLVNGMLMLVALFFLFRDGESMTRTLRDLLPMDALHTQRVFQRLYDTVSAVVQSMLLTAVAQGVLGGFGYAVIGGIQFAVFLGFLTALASFLPVVGGAGVWMPAAIWLLLTDHVGRGIGLIAWGVGVMGMADNVIRPLVIGGRAAMPGFLLFFGLFGGLQVYGFIGLFLAPAVIASLLAFVDIYRELYGPGAEPAAAPDVPA